MTISASLEKVIEIVGAAPCPHGHSRKAVFRGLEYDSRQVQGGELFIALKGQELHGEKFLDQAFGRGAALALIEDRSLLDTSPHRQLLLAVPDTLQAFWKLATWWRRETNLAVLGITGSVGKTTVKELSAAILLSCGVGAYAQKSFNNHVGVPYTVCKMHRDHSWAVIEMGMNHAGEISSLSKIAQPNVAAITAIAPAHIEHFSGIEAIARAKLEIREGMSRDGTLVLNRDSEVLMSEWKQLNENRRALFFGASSQADCQVKHVESRGLNGISFTLRLFSEETKVTMAVLGRQYALNAACAALSAAALLPSLRLDAIAAALSSFKAPLMRLNQHELPDGRVVIDDSYNANPASMRSMLELARDVASSGKQVALVLGDMLEQGAFAEKHHREIGQVAASLRPTCLIAVGPNAKHYHQAACASGVDSTHTLDCDEATACISTKAWQVLFVKASRSVGLDALVAKLLGR